MGPDREDPSQPTECDASTGNGLSMADENRLRSYRSNDPYRRAAEPPQPSEPAGASDPLAELARLIGQSDPFAEFGRSNQRQAGPAALAPQAQPAPHGQYRPRDDYAQPDSYPASAHARDDWRHAAAQGSSYRSGQGVAQGAREDFGKDWTRESPHEQHYAADDYSSRDAHRQDLSYKDSGYKDTGSKDSGLGLNFPPRGDSRHANTMIRVSRRTIGTLPSSMPTGNMKSCTMPSSNMLTRRSRAAASGRELARMTSH